MLTQLYKHRDGSLKTGRISCLVFLAVLAAAWALHETSRAKEDLMVRVAHVMAPEPEVPEPEIQPETDPVKESEPVVEKQVPDARAETESPAPPPVQEEPARQDAGPQSQPTPQAAEARPPLSDPPPAEVPEQKVPAEETAAEPEQTVRIAELIPEPPPEKKPEKKKIDPDKTEPGKKRFPEFPKATASRDGDSVELASDDYVKMYTHWRTSGSELDGETHLVPLRIQNLEKVFQLFQMKVVAVKDGVPYMDLTDFTRVAPEALSGYSSTCFLVSRPWEKWGQALTKAGFSKGTPVEVRYYTYNFVRNAIYARAMKAFDWSLASGSLPGDTPPESADVLGRVYAVRQSGGGAFGVFVPLRVDFRSGASVAVDALACFEGAPDIRALKQAGVL